MTDLLEIDDPYDRRLAHGVTGVLADFNRAGVLTSADVRIAARVSDIVGETSEQVRLAFALTVRAVRNGSTCVELAELAAELGAETPELIENEQMGNEEQRYPGHERLYPSF